MNLQSQLNTQRGQILAANSSAQEAKASSFNPKSSNKETPTSNDRRGQTINAVDSQLPPPPQFNYTTEGTYEGETVRFALHGQVLNEEEKERIGDTNLILFGGGGGQCTGLRLYKKTDGARNGVWIGAGTIDGELPSDFDPIDGKFIANSGSGFVYAAITIDTIWGTVENVDIRTGLFVPESNNNITYFKIGFYRHTSANSVELTNYGCGSISVNVCRNWFVSRPPYYKTFVAFSG